VCQRLPVAAVVPGCACARLVAAACRSAFRRRRGVVLRHPPCVPRSEAAFPADVVMSYVGDADVFGDAADTWTPAAMTAKPSTTRTSETIDFMEIPHLNRLKTRIGI